MVFVHVANTHLILPKGAAEASNWAHSPLFRLCDYSTILSNSHFSSLHDPDSLTPPHPDLREHHPDLPVSSGSCGLAHPCLPSAWNLETSASDWPKRTVDVVHPDLGPDQPRYHLLGR